MPDIITEEYVRELEEKLARIERLAELWSKVGGVTGSAGAVLKNLLGSSE